MSFITLSASHTWYLFHPAALFFRLVLIYFMSVMFAFTCLLKHFESALKSHLHVLSSVCFIALITLSFRYSSFILYPSHFLLFLLIQNEVDLAPTGRLHYVTLGTCSLLRRDFAPLFHSKQSTCCGLSLCLFKTKWRWKLASFK